MYRRIHVIPVGDVEIHAAQELCWCHPTETEPRLLVHNAKDCREARERVTGEKCSDGWINIAERVANDMDYAKALLTLHAVLFRLPGKTPEIEVTFRGEGIKVKLESGTFGSTTAFSPESLSKLKPGVDILDTEIRFLNAARAKP